MTAANFVTTLRILLSPVLIYTLLKSEISYLPGIIFSICILTDVLDGFLARRLKAKTKTGKFLDPFADKLLLLSSYFALTLLNRIPMWLFVLVLGRDIIIVSGWLTIYILTGVSKIQVRLLGKLAVILHMTTILVALLGLPLMPMLLYITGFITVLSAIDYCARETKTIAIQ
jgi:CDP-diacylglycerol--glycerol-3-phosphate 3-phosphatidyltransferase